MGKYNRAQTDQLHQTWIMAHASKSLRNIGLSVETASSEQLADALAEAEQVVESVSHLRDELPLADDDLDTRAKVILARKGIDPTSASYDQYRDALALAAEAA
jgi:hypothetical protein